MERDPTTQLVLTALIEHRRELEVLDRKRDAIWVANAIRAGKAPS